MRRATRSKGLGLPLAPCLCGRPFTTRSGRANHARACPNVWARDAAQLADFLAINARARARIAAGVQPIPRVRARTVIRFNQTAGERPGAPPPQGDPTP